MSQLSQNRKRGLGRGLDALFKDIDVEKGGSNKGDTQTPSSSDALPVTSLQPGKYQPRRHFNSTALEELASSIAEHGVLQPLLVRPLDGSDDMFEIIAGERRWRAAQKAKLHKVPVIIQDLSDDIALEIALIENLQREDLTAIEEAEGYKRLVDEFDYTQEQLSKKLGKSRSQVTNTLRLLKLPEKIKGYVQEDRLTAGHARALLSAKEPVILAQKVMKEGLSVRDTEKLALTFGTDIGNDKASKQKRYKNFKKDVDTLALEKELTSQIGMRVSITPAPDGSGRLMIQYKSLDQLDSLIGKIAS